METILIVANSGRMLAQAAKNMGLKPLVVDLFADLDMQGCAEDFCQVNSLAEPDLAFAVDYFVRRYAVSHVIYGSGFECYPQSLYYLNSRLFMLGNHPDNFARLHDKRVFFSTLDGLGIPFPEVAFSSPGHCGDWLVKPMQGQGGVGIRRYRVGDGLEKGVYWQKFQGGTPCSVLFLADGRTVRVVGFNSQWPVRLGETQEFVFSGVSNNAGLTDGHKEEVTGWLQQLVQVFGLKGLNSLDFIHLDGCSYVLEINPRPSASMQLYSEGLLLGHIKASTAAWADGLGAPLAADAPLQCAGYQIVYADRGLIIPDQFEWPAWCMDLPKSGNICRAGQPLCSIIAHQKNSRSVARLLLTRQQLIINKLKRFWPSWNIQQA